MHIISINKMKTKNLTITLPEESGKKLKKQSRIPNVMNDKGIK